MATPSGTADAEAVRVIRWSAESRSFKRV